MLTLEDLPEELLEKILFLLEISDLYVISKSYSLLPLLWVRLAKKRLKHIRFSLIDSDGVAAYYEGAALGEFSLNQEHGHYVQRNGPYKILESNKMWEVEHKEGFSPFLNRVRSSVPPVMG